MAQQPMRGGDDRQQMKQCKKTTLFTNYYTSKICTAPSEAIEFLMPDGGSFWLYSATNSLLNYTEDSSTTMSHSCFFPSLLYSDLFPFLLEHMDRRTWLLISGL